MSTKPRMLLASLIASIALVQPLSNGKTPATMDASRTSPSERYVDVQCGLSGSGSGQFDYFVDSFKGVPGGSLDPRDALERFVKKALSRLDPDRFVEAFRTDDFIQYAMSSRGNVEATVEVVRYGNWVIGSLSLCDSV